MDFFTVIAGTCSILSLVVSLFVASKVVTISKLVLKTSSKEDRIINKADVAVGGDSGDIEYKKR